MRTPPTLLPVLLRNRYVAVTALLFVLLTQAALSQIPSRTDVTDTPVPNVGHDYIHAPVETVNPANGSLSIRIGVPMPPGRNGFKLPFNFSYDSNGAFYLIGATNSILWDSTKTILSQGGWSYAAPMLSIQGLAYTGEDDNGNTIDCEQLVDFVMQDASGNRQNLGLTYSVTPSQWCAMGQMTGPVTTANVGSFQAQTTADCCSLNSVTVWDADGTSYSFDPPSYEQVPQTDPCFYPCEPTTYTADFVTDRNGNGVGIISGGLHGGPMLQYNDGRTLLNTQTFGSNPDTITVSGLANPYQVYWTTANSNFSLTFTHINDGSYTCSTPSSGGLNVPAVSEILLPNNQAFTFSYDSNYGLVNKITYPTGGYVRYVWGLNPQSELISGTYIGGNATGKCDYYYDNPAIVNRYVSYDGTHEVLEQDFSYSTSWGNLGNPYDVWSQKQTTVKTHDLVRGTVYSTRYTYSSIGSDFQPNSAPFGAQGQIPVESKIEYFKDTNTNGSPIRTVNKAWGSDRILMQQQTILDNGYLAESDWIYDTNEMEKDRKDYDYGPNGTHGNILRETVIPSYHSFSSHIVDRPDNVQVTDGNPNSPTVYAGVNYQYDGNGNILDRYDWLNQNGSSYLQTSHTYDSYGNMISTTDPAQNTTTYSYTDNWVATCPGVSYPSLYLTQITYPPTNGVQHNETFAYNCPTGDLASSTDMNGNPTSYQYNDAFARLTEIDYPPGWGKSTVTYTDTPGALSMETKRIDNNGAVWADSLDLFDDLFHTVAHSAANGESTPWNRVDTCYDGDGRTMFVSYPFQTSSDTGTPNCSGTGDTTVYDVLGRAKTITHSDGSVVTTNYTGRATDVLDEGNGTRSIERVSQIDGLGRLINVCEVTGQAQQNGSPSPCNLDYSGSGFLTTYGYNQRGDLTSVAQGSLSRSFSYDMQSRLISATNPESGTITYNYDSDSTCTTDFNYPAFSGELMSQVDARGTRACLNYDALHHLINKSYTDGTPTVTYNYDQTSLYGRTLTGTNGRKSSESTAGSNPTGAVFSYDTLGHVIDNSQCTPQNCANNTAFPVTYASYNVLGSPNSETNGVGVTISYGYNSAGALFDVTSSESDANHPGTLLNNVHYNAFGSPVSSSIGSLPLTDSRGYTTRGFLSSVSVSGPSTPSTGSVTVNGSEGNQLNSPATAGTGSVSLSGSEQSTQVLTQAATSGSESFGIHGREQSLPGRPVIYDSGDLCISINSYTKCAAYGQNSTSSTVASEFATAFNNDPNSPVSASAGGSTVTFTARATGASTNYATSSWVDSYDSNDFIAASFGATPASGALSGGANAVYTTVYDSGTATITVNGHGDSYSWANGSSASSIASGLASAINGDGSASASASASGAVVYLTAKTTGSGTDYSLSSSTTWNTSYFGSSSFALTSSGSAFTGGANATYTYDSGTVTITANGTQSSASYGQSSTNTSIASALASAVNANNSYVSASASGNVVTLTSRTGGAYTNYSLSASSSGSFNPASFTASTSGGNMTGGTGNLLYSVGVSYYNNGDVQTANDSVNGNWTYTYDDFNRLSTAVASNITQGCSEAYDQYGNRWSQAPYGGSGYACSSWSQSFTGNNNRINPGSGYGYDAAGNMTSDPTYTYTYDAENRIVAVNGGSVATYVYDAEGQRVRKTAGGSTVDYLYDLSGHVITELSSSGGWNRGEIYAGSTHLTTYMGGTSGNTYFTHSDWLGNERVRSTVSGGVYSTWANLPFGEGSSTPNPGPTHFTGKERDQETAAGGNGLDYFGARYFSSTMGRFMSPDWADKPTDVPYAEFGDPQSLNLYGYVGNNPMSKADADGHTSLAWLRVKAVKLAWAQERALIASGKPGTFRWTAAERQELLQTGKVGGYQGHHINSVNGHEELAGNPDNIRFVRGAQENLDLHGGDFRNPTSGDLLSRSLGSLSVVQTITSLLPAIAESLITGVYEGWSFRGGVPNPDALFLNDPGKAASTLDGNTITVFGPKGASTDYSVHDGGYYQAGSNTAIDPNQLMGKEFALKPSCANSPCN